MTIPDLIWLTVGVAVAASVGWYHIDVAPRSPSGALPPGTLLSTDFGVETLMKACLALLPVVIARRVRYGGPIRAVEFALLTVGFSHLMIRIEQSPWTGMAYTSLSAPGRLLMQVDLYVVWRAGTLAVAVLALIVAAIRRHRGPAWVAGILLVIAYFGISNAGVGYVRGWMNEHLPRDWFGPGTMHVPYLFVATGPFQVIWFLPIAASLVETIRREGRAWTWVDRAAFGLPVLLELVGYTRSFFKMYRGKNAFPSEGEYAWIVMILGSLGLATLWVRALRPAWGRFFAIRKPTVDR